MENDQNSSDKPSNQEVDNSVEPQSTPPEPNPEGKPEEQPQSPPSEPNPEEKSQESQQSRTPVSSNSPRTNKGLKIIVLVVIIIIAVIAGLYLYKHYNNKQGAAAVIKKDIPVINVAFVYNPFNVFYPNDNFLEGPYEPDEQIFEGLVKFENGTQIVPALATSWTNPNDTTWVFKLRPNVKFHDGDTLTAQDVVYTWQYLTKNSPNICAIACTTIKNVQALNNQTVQITTYSPDAILLNRLASLWIIDSKAPAGTQPWELGTGAYTVKPGTTPNANTLHLVAFNNWWGGHAYTRAVNYTFFANTNNAVTAMQKGEDNVADNVSLGQAATLKKDGFKEFDQPQLSTAVVSFYTQNPSYPTANPKIREAFDLALNPVAIMKAYDVKATLDDQPLPAGIPGYDPSITRPPLNLVQAAKLVKEAGYPNGVTITFGVGEPSLSAGQEIAKELAPIGIHLKLEVATDEGTYFNNWNSGKYMIVFISQNTVLTDGSDFLAYWDNQPYYNNPTLDSELNQANQTFNPTLRIKFLQEASQTFVSDNAAIPLFNEYDVMMSKPNFVFPLGNYDQDMNVYFSSVYQK